MTTTPLTRLLLSLEAPMSMRLMETIRHPMRKGSLCGHALLNALLPVSKDPKGSLCVTCSFETPHRLAPSLLKFILIPGNFAALEERLSRCTCKIGNNDTLSMLHGPLPYGGKYNFKSLMASIFNICEYLIIGLKLGRAHIIAYCEHNCQTNKNKGATFKVEWLRDTSTLMPGGAHSTAKIIAEWVKILQIPHPLSLFKHLVLHCPSLLPEMDELFEQSSQLLMSIGRTSSRSRDPLQSIIFTPAVELLLIVDFIALVRSSLGCSSIGALNELDRKFGLKLFNALISAHARLSSTVRTDPRTADSYPRLLDLIGNMWESRDIAGWKKAAKFPSDRALRIFLSQVDQLHHGTTGEEGWGFFRVFIIGFANANKCCHKPCSATVDVIHKALRQCSNCGTLRYCSRECQKASWNAEGALSHKAVCASLGKLKAVKCGNPKSLEDNEEWVQKVHEAGVTEHDIVLLARYIHAYVDPIGNCADGKCQCVKEVL